MKNSAASESRRLAEYEHTIQKILAANLDQLPAKDCFFAFFALWLNLVYAFAGVFTAMETLLKHYETSFETLLGTQLETTTNRHRRNPTQHIGE